MTVSRLRPADKVSDIDLSNWQKYPDILTDSLWILDSRDSSGAHQADYHDIIRFSDNPADLSNCQDTDIFWNVSYLFIPIFLLSWKLVAI